MGRDGMGFKAKTVYTLTFEGNPVFEGMEVKIRETTIGETVEMATMTTIEDTYSMLARLIVDWNLEDDDGTPVPVTLEGMLGQEQKTMDTIVQAYQQARDEVPVPLETPSNDGNSSVDLASIPMETLSPSLAS